MTAKPCVCFILSKIRYDVIKGLASCTHFDIDTLYFWEQTLIGWFQTKLSHIAWIEKYYFKAISALLARAKHRWQSVANAFRKNLRPKLGFQFEFLNLHSSSMYNPGYHLFCNFHVQGMFFCPKYSHSISQILYSNIHSIHSRTYETRLSHCF